MTVRPTTPSSAGMLRAMPSPEDDAFLADALFRWTRELLPLRRCITGDGLRETLRWVQDRVEVDVSEVPTGTPVLDWTVPKEWHVREAYLQLPDGRRVADWATSPLHLVQYSEAVRTRLTLDDLLASLHTLPEQPQLVPYRTSYYVPTWGFCIAQSVLDDLQATLAKTDEIDVVIDAEQFDGSLTYGEVVVPGISTDEILVSAHACHPALANDNSTSIAVATALTQRRAAGPKRWHTLRVLLAPGTIGAITWLGRNRSRLGSVRAGLVLSNLGDAGPFTYKRSRRGTIGDPALIDRAACQALQDGAHAWSQRPFEPSGYDERQFCSPGFDLPVGRLTRTPHHEYPEYHTSGDNMDLIRPESLLESLQVIERTLNVLDGNASYRNLAPYGEPMLGRYGLYQTLDGTPLTPDVQSAVLWILNLSDGDHSLLDIAQRSGLPFESIRSAADRLAETDLLVEIARG